MELDTVLINYRDQIDTIDHEMIYLLSRRFELVRQIWNIKKELWENPLQPKRWQEVLDKLFLEADDRWIDRDFIEKIWNTIHEEALKIEK